jgi:glycosyltransferase involved in cell wall biosynthesis
MKPLLSTNGSNGDASAAVAVAVAEAVYEREALRPTERERLEEQRAATGGRRGNHSTTRVSIVIPALNEARNLRHVLANLPDGLFEVLLVPGSSTDDTETVVRTLRPDARIIRQTRHGKGNALACAFAACEGDIVITLDADGSANPREIPAFVGALLSGADFAKGTRFIQGGGSHDMTLVRQLGNWGLTRLANVLHGTHYSDLCYGYNAFWRRCLPQLNADIDGFEVETLINLRAAKSGLRVTEVASFELDRIHGHSNLKTFRDGWRVLGTILREWVPRHRRVAHTAPRRIEAGERRAARRTSTL